MAGANNAQLKRDGWKAADITKARATHGALSHAAMAREFTPKQNSHAHKKIAEPATKARDAAAKAAEHKATDLAARRMRTLSATMMANRKAQVAKDKNTAAQLEKKTRPEDLTRNLQGLFKRIAANRNESAQPRPETHFKRIVNLLHDAGVRIRPGEKGTAAHWADALDRYQYGGGASGPMPKWLWRAADALGAHVEKKQPNIDIGKKNRETEDFLRKAERERNPDAFSKFPVSDARLAKSKGPKAAREWLMANRNK